MSKLFFLFIIILGSFKLYSQDVKLDDLKTPNSPGFQILDISPSSIERPTNPKEFSAKILGLVNGTALPKNFAFEFSPFWYFKPKTENIYKYFNLSEDSNSTINDNSFSGLTRKFNVSFASSFNDSTAGSLLRNTNYISIGARTNLLTIRTKKQNKLLVQNIDSAAKIMTKVSGRKPDGNRPSLKEIEEALDKNEEFQEQISQLQKLPLVQLDVAYAYSDAFADNDHSRRRFNRVGIWFSLALNQSFNTEDNSKHDLSLILLGKSAKDNVLTDSTNMIFEKKNLVDFGAKLEYALNRLTISFEYIKRNYKTEASLDSERSVGLLQYKVNDNLYVTGTFGKNFGNIKNVFTLFGLNWGFGSTPLQMK